MKAETYTLKVLRPDDDARTPAQVAEWLTDGVEIHVEAQDDLPPLTVAVAAVGERPSPELLAGHVIAQVTHDVEGTGIMDLKQVHTFSELHDWTDANMYLVYACEDLGGWSADLNSDADVAVLNATTDLVNAWLALPLLHLRGGDRE